MSWNKIKLACTLATSIFVISFSCLTPNKAFATITFANASGLGNAYAGEAAIADDSSTLFYNPAGLTFIKNPQLIISDNGVYGFTRFNGSATLIPASYTQTGQTISKIYGQIPTFFFTSPVSSKVTVGIGGVPVLGYAISNFSNNSLVRYVGTKSQIAIFALTPGLSYAINDNFSIGLGLDLEYLYAQFQNRAQLFGVPGSVPDQNSQNIASGYGYGWHAGLLYNFNPCTRVGLTYHSIVSFNASGTSEFSIPGVSVDTVYRSNHFKVRFPNPPVIALSVYHEINPNLAVMGTIDYIEWGRIKTLTGMNVALPPAFGSLTTTSLTTHYHNEWEFLAGVNYRISCPWLLRAGGGFATRYSTTNVPSALQGAPAGVLAIGAQYQATKALSFDMGLMNTFLWQNADINFQNSITKEKGKHYFYLGVLGGQLTYNFL